MRDVGCGSGRRVRGWEMSAGREMIKDRDRGSGDTMVP